MKLADWLEAQNISHQEFGDRIGKSQAAVSRYVAGKRMPDEETLIKIFEETNGGVTPNDFVNLPDLDGPVADEAGAAAEETEPAAEQA
jgi:transcriptional regulator with XRE-family HTH domain